MKKTAISLILLPLLLTGCKGRTYYGTYSFQLGREGEKHAGAKLELTKEKWSKAYPKNPEHDLYTFHALISYDMSTEGQAVAEGQPKTEFKADGYYYVNEIKNKDKSYDLKLGIDVNSILDGIRQKQTGEDGKPLVSGYYIVGTATDWSYVGAQRMSNDTSSEDRVAFYTGYKAKAGEEFSIWHYDVDNQKETKYEDKYTVGEIDKKLDIELLKDGHLRVIDHELVPGEDDAEFIEPEIVETIIYSTIHKDTVTISGPVSVPDLCFQLFWYGWDIDISDPESDLFVPVKEEFYQSLPKAKEDDTEVKHGPGTHPTADQIEAINKSEEWKNSFYYSLSDYIPAVGDIVVNYIVGDITTFRDYNTVTISLKKA